MGLFNSKPEVKKDSATIFNRSDLQSDTYRGYSGYPYQAQWNRYEGNDYQTQVPNWKNELDHMLRLYEEEQRQKQKQEEELARQFERLSLSENRYDFQPIPVKIDSLLIYNFTAHTGNDTRLRDINTVYDITQLEDNSSEFSQIKTLFTKTNKKCFKVSTISKIYNPYLLTQYKLMESCYQRRHGYTNEKLLFHGTKKSNIDNICKYNFNWRLKGTARGHKFGQGVSFTPIANYATHYGDKTYEKVMIVAKVLVSKTCVGNADTVLPPSDYDTTTKEDNHVFVKYEDNSFYPAYIIYYEGTDIYKNHGSRRNFLYY